MDFIVGLPNTTQQHDSIWVIIDRLTKTAHFLPVHSSYTAKKYAEIYVDQIIRLHGVPKTIISDRGSQFVACFWQQLQASLGTKSIRSEDDGPRIEPFLLEHIKGLSAIMSREWLAEVELSTEVARIIAPSYVVPCVLKETILEAHYCSTVGMNIIPKSLS